MVCAGPVFTLLVGVALVITPARSARHSKKDIAVRDSADDVLVAASFQDGSVSESAAAEALEAEAEHGMKSAETSKGPSVRLAFSRPAPFPTPPKPSRLPQSKPRPRPPMPLASLPMFPRPSIPWPFPWPSGSQAEDVSSQRREMRKSFLRQRLELMKNELLSLTMLFWRSLVDGDCEVSQRFRESLRDAPPNLIDDFFAEAGKAEANDLRFLTPKTRFWELFMQMLFLLADSDISGNTWQLLRDDLEPRWQSELAGDAEGMTAFDLKAQLPAVEKAVKNVLAVQSQLTKAKKRLVDLDTLRSELDSERSQLAALKFAEPSNHDDDVQETKQEVGDVLSELRKRSDLVKAEETAMQAAVEAAVLELNRGYRAVYDHL